MMLCKVKIKEEPLDINGQEVQHESKSNNQRTKNCKEDTTNLDNFQIVEEEEGIITVNAANMLKSEDELQFIKDLQEKTQTTACMNCLKTFSNPLNLIDHQHRNKCTKKYKCPVCPLTFVKWPSYMKHLNLHRDNQFFCSLNCGTSFKSITLCDEHELREHKKINPSRIRYKHFCSFCVEGFKTELLLHAHWMQLNQKCGQNIKEIVQHSNVNIYKQITNENLSDNTMQNIPQMMPITKLRLKSSPTINKSPKNKRIASYNEQLDDINNFQHDIWHNKRAKTMQEIKAETNSNILPFNLDPALEIKEEPLDEDENDIHTSSAIIPEVIIKTEDDQGVMKTLTEQTEMAEEQPAAIIPLPPKQLIHPTALKFFKPLDGSTNCNLKNFRFVKLTTAAATGTTPTVASAPFKNLSISPTLTFNRGGLQIIPLPRAGINNVKTTTLLSPTSGTGLLGAGMQIFKILPAINNDVAKLNPQQGCLLQQQQHDNNNNKEQKPVIIRLQSAATNADNSEQKQSQTFIKANFQILPLKSPASAIKSLVTTTVAAPITTTTTTTTTTTSPAPSLSGSMVTFKLNSLNQCTTLDLQDLQRLQLEALQKVEEDNRKNLVIPNTTLKVIESIPEKKLLLENMKEQIQQIANKDEQQQPTPPQTSPSPTSSLFKCSTNNFSLMNLSSVMKKDEQNELPVFYVPVLTEFDLELVKACRQHPQYIYKLVCPYCQKVYDYKAFIRRHLTKAHNLTTRDMEKINIQAKAFRKGDETQDESEQPAPEGSAINIKQEDLNSSDDSLTQQTFPQTNLSTSPSSISPGSTTTINPIKMSALNIKERYTCDKCGRRCSSKTMLNDHILANCSREPHHCCPECPKKFFSAGTLNCHMSIHTGELPHKCDYCEKRFRTRGQVTVHHRTHTGEKPFACQVCSQRFTHRETLIAHLSRHIGMKRYKCYGCEKTFSCISALKTHRETRPDSCAKVKFNPRAVGPRVRVVRGNVIFERQPDVNPYLKSEDPKEVLAELQNQIST